MTTATQPTLTVARCDTELERYRAQLDDPRSDRTVVLRLIDRWLDLRLTCDPQEH
jgi:hypothetical protein